MPGHDDVVGGRPADPGWVHIGAADWRSMLLVATTPSFGVLFLVQIAVHIGGPLLRGSPSALVVNGVTVLLIVIAVGVLVATVLLTNGAWVNVSRREIRSGLQRAVPFAAVDQAKLVPLRARGERPLRLELFAGRRRCGNFLIRSRTGEPLAAESRVRLLAVIDGSSITLPSAPEDPSGRFTRYNFPNHVGKDDALELVRTPPGPDDQHPISG
jgi:hypothetical protein